MIHQLRRGHRVIFAVLVLALIVLFIAALAVRPSAPAPNSLRLPSPEKPR